MKTILTFIAAASICCMTATAQVSNLQNNDMGNNGGTTNSLTYSWTAPSGTTTMAVCLEGDNITGGHDDITGITYNGTSMTRVGVYNGADGSVHNNRFLYLYKLNSPSTGSAHNIVASSTNNHYLLGVVTAYGGSSDLAGTVYSLGPTATASSPWTVSAYTQSGGSIEMFCAEGGSQVSDGNTVVEIQGSAFAEPSIVDTGSPIGSPSSLSLTTKWSGLNGTHWDDIRIMAEVLPSTTQFTTVQSAGYTSSNSWVFNASDSGMLSADYEASAWDTTTSPYTNITSSATFTTDANYNLTASFSGNKTGFIGVVANPTKCKTASAPCIGTPPVTTHGITGPLKSFVTRDSSSSGAHSNQSTTITWTHTIGSSCTNPYLIVAVAGPANPTSVTATASYNSVSMTQLSSVNVANGSGSAGNNFITWLFGIAPSSTGSHTVSVTMSGSSGPVLAGDSSSYCGVNDVVGGQTSPHNEIFSNLTTSPGVESVYPLEAGSMTVAVTGTQQVSADNTDNSYLVTNNGQLNHTPTIFDTKTYITTGFHFGMGITFNPSWQGLNFMVVHLRPAAPVYWSRYQSAVFSSGTTWTANATDTGMQTCDYQASAWDTTTSPYTDLTSLATFSCDGSNNITATFSANQTGKMIIVPNGTVSP